MPQYTRFAHDCTTLSFDGGPVPPWALAKLACRMLCALILVLYWLRTDVSLTRPSRPHLRPPAAESGLPYDHWAQDGTKLNNIQYRTRSQGVRGVEGGATRSESIHFLATGRHAQCDAGSNREGNGTVLQPGSGGERRDKAASKGSAAAFGPRRAAQRPYARRVTLPLRRCVSLMPDSCWRDARRVTLPHARRVTLPLRRRYTPGSSTT